MTITRYGFTLALALAAGGFPAGAKLNVLTTTSDLADIARAVGGDRIDVSSIAPGTQDAHFVEAKPSYMIKARAAELFIEVGMELEVAWAGSVVEGSRNPRLAVGQPGRLDASTGVLKVEVPAGAKRHPERLAAALSPGQPGQL